MKQELLSPAGSMDALKMAVYHGADAVYLGGKRFGARANATNFSESEMLEAIFFCHLYGVKIYVTVNTMIYESELDEVKAYLEFLYRHHVDAVIMADIGLMKLCKECFPELEIHASTQVHIHNVSQLEILRKLGVKRVVVARELSLEEIKQFPDDIDIEVFIHGALCISYSGQCLFSSLLLNRSGNRGECAQICRLPFQLLKNGKEVSTNGDYLLSTRDLNTSNHFQELLSSNIKSFKIEGRMKSPAYVGFMTGFYRNLMDRYQERKILTVSKEDTRASETLFGRGFTNGFLFGAKDETFMNQKTSNHQGSHLGVIERLDSKKIGIRLDYDLNQEDGIRFVEGNQGMIVNFLYNSKGLLVSSAKKGELVFVDNKIGVSQFGEVMKTLDKKLEESILASPEKKIPILMRVSISLGFVELEIEDGEHQVKVSDTCVESSISCPLTKESVMRQFGKLGGTPFVARDIIVHIDGHLYMNVRDMNELRRKGIDELIKQRVFRKDVVVTSSTRSIYEYDNKLEIAASATNESQVQALLQQGISKIYVRDYSLYQKYLDKGVMYRTNRVNHTNQYPKASHIMAGESGVIQSSFEECYLDYFFNIANHATADFWESFGIRQMCLTPEITDMELENLLEKYPKGNPFEFLIYGRLEVMVLNHCILRMNVNQEKICKVCKGNDSYALKDRNGKAYPIWMDRNHHTHLMHYDKIDSIKNVKKYFQLGLRKFRLEFYEESANEIEKILQSVKKQLCV